MPEESSRASDVVAVLVQSLSQDVRLLSIANAETQRDLKEVAKELNALNRVVRGENGKDSMAVRLALVERAIGEAAGSLIEVRKAIENRLAEDQKGKWQLVCTILSILGAIICAILALRK